jgi:hypothetical protein
VQQTLRLVSGRCWWVGRERGKRNKLSSMKQKNIRLSSIFCCCCIRVFRGELSIDRCSRRSAKFWDAGGGVCRDCAGGGVWRDSAGGGVCRDSGGGGVCRDSARADGRPVEGAAGRELARK